MMLGRMRELPAVQRSDELSKRLQSGGAWADHKKTIKVGVFKRVATAGHIQENRKPFIRKGFRPGKC